MLLETFRDITWVCGNIAKGICEGYRGTIESTEKHNYCTLFFMQPLHPVFSCFGIFVDADRRGRIFM